MNLRIDLAYDGAPFRGFARQPGQTTVQGTLEDALERVTGTPVRTTCAGRTDAGVHALGQVVSAPGLSDEIDLERLPGALDALCGPAIAIRRIGGAPEGWDARFSARSRLYCYAILEGERDPFRSSTTLHHPDPLDLDAMSEAAGHLVGTHDFSSFGRPPENGGAERTLFELAVERSGQVVRVTARANAFIQQMVRSLVGTLVAAGEGKLSPDRVPEIIAARNRSAAGPVAPPHALCLVAVEYDEGWSGPVV